MWYCINGKLVTLCIITQTMVTGKNVVSQGHK